MKKTIVILFVATITFTSCKMADIRTPLVEENQNPQRLEDKGRALLAESVKAMGYDNLENVSTYEANVNFKWRGMWKTMPFNAFPGSGRNGKKNHKFRFKPLTFDGSITYLDGRKEGDVHGIQSFESYETVNNKPLEFKKDKKRTWGLATWHYVLEAPIRLLNNATIIQFAGEDEFDGTAYDKVFVTWGEDTTPNKEIDQYILWINSETKFVDIMQVTVRDFFMPMPKNMAWGAAHFTERQRTDAGIYFPKAMSLQFFKPKDPKKYVYSVKLSDFKFNSFQEDVLYPNASLQRYGDAKPDNSK